MDFLTVTRWFCFNYIIVDYIINFIDKQVSNSGLTIIIIIGIAVIPTLLCLLAD